MSKGPVVSVVTPVYNGESYLPECIESVLAQTWTDFEYIVADNCSTDATVAIAREYAARDLRIRVVTADEFVTADANANRALREIDQAAKYVKVVHADDWLFPTCLEKMVGLAEAHPRVGVVSAYRQLGEDVDLTGLPTDVTVLPGETVGHSALLGGPLPYLFGSPTSLLIRADLVRARPELYSLDNPHQSDQEACLDLLRESDLGFVHEPLTFTRRHEAAESPYLPPPRRSCAVLPSASARVRLVLPEPGRAPAQARRPSCRIPALPLPPPAAAAERRIPRVSRC